jgi:hypothetical protein
LIGAPGHARQKLQCQYPIASGDPGTSISTAPRKHFPAEFMVRPHGVEGDTLTRDTLTGLRRYAR